MSETIHKFDLMPQTGPQTLTFSKGARILSAGFQVTPEGLHVMRVWAIVEEYAQEHDDYTFWIVPTGRSVPGVYNDQGPQRQPGLSLLGRAEYPGVVVHVFYALGRK